MFRKILYGLIILAIFLGGFSVKEIKANEPKSIQTYNALCYYVIKDVYGNKVVALQQTVNWSWDTVQNVIKVNWATWACSPLRIGHTCVKMDNNFNTLPTSWKTKYVVWSTYRIDQVIKKKITTTVFGSGYATCKMVNI